MLYIITGVSGSGKSEYAENLAVKLAADAPLYYAATMEPYGQEGRERIRRHHKLREGKGFQTIECYRDITRIVEEIGQAQCRNATILLECMSNLLANEMFGERMAAEPVNELSTETEQTAEADQQNKTKMTLEQEKQNGLQQQERHTGQIADRVLADRLLSGMSYISRQCRHLIVVTNEVFSDGIEYAPETEAYRRQLGRLNRELIGMADEAVEVVYSIPVRII